MAGYIVYNIKMYLWEGGREGGKDERRKGRRERERLILRSPFVYTEKSMLGVWQRCYEAISLCLSHPGLQLLPM